MKTKRKWIGMLAFIVMIAVLMIVTMQTPGTIADPENYQCQTYATVFALLPPVIAIGLALITKEVYTHIPGIRQLHDHAAFSLIKNRVQHQLQVKIGI